MTKQLSINVTNAGPSPADRSFVNQHLLEAFLSMMPKDLQCKASPHVHQQTAFETIQLDQPVRMIAGTAAGKTLGLAIPVFEKLFREKRIGKVLFLYPTLALLEDQRRTLDRLLQHYVQKYQAPQNAIGLIQGGLSRSKLLRQLSRPVVVATPDAVYWFLRKNVKYSDFLIYGLVQADEIIIDEAHLFTGLMLHNMVHFLNRLRFLRREYLGREPVFHYLTATEANPGLKSLSPQSIAIQGKSKCGPVRLTIEERFPPWEREDRFIELVKGHIAAGKRRILVVTNSARRAHLLFDKLRDTRKGAPRPKAPAEFWRQFGVVQLGQAIDALALLDAEAAKQVRNRVKREIRLGSRRISPQIIRLNTDYCASEAAAWLNVQYRELRNAIYRYASKAGENFSGLDLMDAFEGYGLANKRRMLNLNLRHHSDRESALAHLDEKFTVISAWLDNGLSQIGSDGGIVLASLDAGGFRALFRSFSSKTDVISDLLIDALAQHMAKTLILDADSLVNVEDLDFKLYAKERLRLRQLLRWIDESNLRENWSKAIIAAKTPNHAAVGVLRDDSQQSMVLLYSGSMARHTREGIIELFDSQEVETPIILIATQAVEVGVDFDADALITEECPGSGFLQRFGRVGRRGRDSSVHLLVGPEAFDGLSKAWADQAQVDREEFSSIISQVLREREYVSASRYADAVQRAVSLQLGQVGEHYAETTPDAAVDSLLEQLREANIDITYGLRGTLPGVTLRNSGVSKEPFYILRYVDNNKLRPTDSPFEAVQAEMSFNEMIYRPAIRDVVVDVDTSLERCQAIAVPSGQDWQIITMSKVATNPAHLYLKLRTLPVNVRRLMLDRFAALPATALDAPQMLLVYGDLYLTGIDRETGLPQLVEQYDSSPVVLNSQWYMVLPGLSNERSAQNYLLEKGIADLDSEIYYDFDALENDDRRGTNRIGLVLVERQAGAVWALAEQLRRGSNDNR